MELTEPPVAGTGSGAQAGLVSAALVGTPTPELTVALSFLAPLTMKISVDCGPQKSKAPRLFAIDSSSQMTGSLCLHIQRRLPHERRPFETRVSNMIDSKS